MPAHADFSRWGYADPYGTGGVERDAPMMSRLVPAGGGVRIKCALALLGAIGFVAV